jgi:hypothetical protein
MGSWFGHRLKIGLFNGTFLKKEKYHASLDFLLRRNRGVQWRCRGTRCRRSLSLPAVSVAAPAAVRSRGGGSVGSCRQRQGDEGIAAALLVLEAGQSSGCGRRRRDQVALWSGTRVSRRSGQGWQECRCETSELVLQMLELKGEMCRKKKLGTKRK